MMEDFYLGDTLVQPALCRLTVDGRTLQVRAKVMDLLAYLARHPRDVISKDRLLDEVWGSQAISESALTRTVTELRQALGDDASEPRLLETIPKRGYRLIGAVSIVASGIPLVAPPWVAPMGVTTATEAPRRRHVSWFLFVVLAVVIVACVVAVLTVRRRMGRVGTVANDAASSGHHVRSLAVLPFNNLSGDPGQEYV